MIRIVLIKNEFAKFKKKWVLFQTEECRLQENTLNAIEANRVHPRCPPPLHQAQRSTQPPGSPDPATQPRPHQTMSGRGKGCAAVALPGRAW